MSALLAAGGALAATGLVLSFLLRGPARSACLALVLVGYFLLLAEFVRERAGAATWVPVAVFAGAVALFRLLATFEQPGTPAP